MRLMSDVRSPKRSAKVVVVDDDPIIQKLLERFLTERGHSAIFVDTGGAALDVVRKERPDLVILDHVLPDISGLEVLRRVHDFDAHLPVLFVTAQGSSDIAIEAMKLCAFDYLPKPLDLMRVEQKVTRALEMRRLMRVPVVMAATGGDDSESDQFIGRSAAIQAVFKSIGRIAFQDVPALVEGEPGTGRELVARAIYRHGRRKDGPFYIVSCGDFSPAALETELFGSDAGVSSPELRVGRFDQCTAGVLLISEIDRLPTGLQGRLFQKIRDADNERLNGVPPKAPLVVGTTSQPLEKLVRHGKFRTDLYYLLNSFRIVLPPLRERTEDIPQLVDYFVRKFTRVSRTLSDSPARVSEEAMRLLTAYAWPGNVDELQSVLRRALVETKGTIVPSDFLEDALRGDGPLKNMDHALGVTNWRLFADARIACGTQQLYADALAEMEQNLLGLILESTKGNQAKAARILGITRGNLRKKLRHYGFSVARGEGDDASMIDDASQ